jgi:reversibly glycosylated polypeptide / UDP-arabinopyranose mutase
MANIAVIVPTIRNLNEFMEVWTPLFRKHLVRLIIVRDGDIPVLEDYFVDNPEHRYEIQDVIEEPDLIYNKNDGVRNLGFYYIAKHYKDIEYIITLDDDVSPVGDTIQDHIDTLNKRVSTTWLSTASEYMRGFPYEIREEAEVVLSHGVWNGVKDWDAPTQLTLGNREVEFYKGPIPVDIYYPMCGMNIAFKRKMLPYMYYAPMGHRVGLDRFADIWLGIMSKRVIDDMGWAVYSGGAVVNHNRASNVYKNLQKEAKGLELNEKFWKDEEEDPYFELYKTQRLRWEKLISSIL